MKRRKSTGYSSSDIAVPPAMPGIRRRGNRFIDRTNIQTFLFSHFGRRMRSGQLNFDNSIAIVFLADDLAQANAKNNAG